MGDGYLKALRGLNVIKMINIVLAVFAKGFKYIFDVFLVNIFGFGFKKFSKLFLHSYIKPKYESVLNRLV